MNRLLFMLALAILSGCSATRPLQRSKLVSVNHLVESGKYDEARMVVEDLAGNEVSAGWPRTWYSRGLLALTAYREGIEKNDRKKSELYPDQLYVAFESFEKARELDGQGRLDKALAPRYALMANSFQLLGETRFKESKYGEALKAFEHAIRVGEQDFLDAGRDTNLVYNAALAAFEGRNWDKAILYLGELHAREHSTNVAHLLHLAYLEKDDPRSAEKVLRQGIEAHKDHEDLVLLLADLLLRQDQPGRAQEALDEALRRDPDNVTYHNTKGLIFQKTGLFNDAILSYFHAVNIQPDKPVTYLNIATCYYNIGVEIEEVARTITNASVVQVEKAKSTAAFDSAVSWLDKAYELGTQDEALMEEVRQLYRLLRVNDRVWNAD